MARRSESYQGSGKVKVRVKLGQPGGDTRREYRPRPPETLLYVKRTISEKGRGERGNRRYGQRKERVRETERGGVERGGKKAKSKTNEGGSPSFCLA